MSDYSIHPRTPIQKVLTDPSSFATTMIVALIDWYGTEFMDWAPETIMMQTEEDFNFSWNSTLFDRLMAGIAIVKTDRFYKSLPDFIELCNILSGSPATPGVFDPADAAECAWGITEAMLLWPPDNDAPFTEEIRAYIGKMVEMEGIIVPPDILRLGLSDDDKRSKVHNDYQDDPEMFSAIWGVEQDKTDDINSLVLDRLSALLGQLGALKLKNGTTEDVVKNMIGNLYKKK